MRSTNFKRRAHKKGGSEARIEKPKEKKTVGKQTRIKSEEAQISHSLEGLRVSMNEMEIDWREDYKEKPRSCKKSSTRK
jgi:hypothetical protein